MHADTSIVVIFKVNGKLIIFTAKSTFFPISWSDTFNLNDDNNLPSTTARGRLLKKLFSLQTFERV